MDAGLDFVKIVPATETTFLTPIINFPVWLPMVMGTPPTIFADFTTEGTSGHYWYNNNAYSSYSALKAAASGTFTRAGTGYYTNSLGLVASVGNDVPRFDYDPVAHTPNGILLEGAATNRALWSRDLTNAAWIKTTGTAALDQTGADGAATSASSFLATANGATVLQSIILGGAIDTYSVYLKRLTGTGVVSITIDNGGSWVDVTASINSSTYTRVSTSELIISPIFGIRLDSSGDKVAVDFNQLENSSNVGTLASSVIPTTSASVARVADKLTFPWTASIGTYYLYQFPREGELGNSDTYLGTDTSTQLINEGAGVPSVVQTRVGGGAGITTNCNNTLVSPNKFAVSGDAVSRSLCANGGAVVSDANPPMTSTPAELFLMDFGQASCSYGDVAAFGVWSSVTADSARLQMLTT